MALAESFERELSARFDFSRGIETGQKAIAEAAAARIYQLQGKPAPAIVWCQSLYQMVTLPSILIGMFFSDAWQVVSCALAEREVDDSWENDFEQGWEALWSHGGQQLLRGMKQSSRVHQYWQLEAPLFKQCKQQLRDWLISGKLHAFEQRLPKQIVYRKFWAMQLWHLNSVQDRWRLLSEQLVEELGLDLKIWQNQFNQFIPYKAKLDMLCSGSSSSLNSIIMRMGAEPGNQMKHCIWLPMSLPMVATCQIWMDHVHRQAFKDYADEINAWNRLTQSTLGVICLDDVIFACEKPSILSVDEGGRLHNAAGPSLVFSDGFVEYAWHGVAVEPRIIEHPESITIEEIETMENAELRRVLIERYGQARYLQDSGAQEIQHDDFGTLYKKEIPGDEALVMVKVINSTAEPDGSFKDYFLRVPPHIETAHDAVAWTFGFEADQYQPLQET